MQHKRVAFLLSSQLVRVGRHGDGFSPRSRVKFHLTSSTWLLTVMALCQLNWRLCTSTCAPHNKAFAHRDGPYKYCEQHQTRMIMSLQQVCVCVCACECWWSPVSHYFARASVKLMGFATSLITSSFCECILARTHGISCILVRTPPILSHNSLRLGRRQQ